MKSDRRAFLEQGHIERVKVKAGGSHRVRQNSSTHAAPRPLLHRASTIPQRLSKASWNPLGPEFVVEIADATQLWAAASSTALLSPPPRATDKRGARSSLSPGVFTGLPGGSGRRACIFMKLLDRFFHIYSQVTIPAPCGDRQGSI